ncbi:hypothetical protein [Brevirhabdus sp.]|uniref:hypothetical protein n=1 Tax=Brevirhabdus sp. TaxID=2004514 RepID=UPI00405963AA
MRGPIASLAGLLFLAACAANPVEQTTRTVARNVVGPIVAERFPGVPAQALTDCIIDNAATHELLEIAKAATLGPGADTYAVVLGIARRPEVLRCAAINVLPQL